LFLTISPLDISTRYFPVKTNKQRERQKEENKKMDGRKEGKKTRKTLANRSLSQCIL
jgi:hypothetical protein